MRSLILITIATLIAPIASMAADPAPPDAASYADVKEWWGSYSITITGHQSSAGSYYGLPHGAEFTARRHCDGTFHLNKAAKGGLMIGHEPDLSNIAEMQQARSWMSLFDIAHIPQAYVTIDDDFHGTSDQHVEGKAVDHFGSSTTTTGHGLVKSVQPVQLVISPDKRLYSMILPYDAINSSELQVSTRKYDWEVSFDGKTTDHERTSTTGGPRLKPKFLIDKSHNPNWIVDQKLPEGDNVEPLKGTVTYTGVPLGEENPAKFLTVQISWVLDPKPPPEVELILEPFDENEYTNWIPQGGDTEEQLGNIIGVYARLQNKDKSPLTEKARKITFHLIEASREPGVCINWPITPVKPDMSDLQFCMEENKDPDIKVEDDHTAVCSHDGGVDHALVQVSSFDFGAHALVEVDAELDSGRIIRGHLHGDADQFDLRLPKSRPGSRIADAWRKSHPGGDGDDQSDDEDDPRGDGHKGDGFTLYEEYRGFIANNVHESLDPKKKDFFIIDTTHGGVSSGYRLFKHISGLATHIISNDDVNPDCGINHNSVYAHHVTQHGVRVQYGTYMLNGFEASIAEGGPGTPMEITGVYILPNLAGKELRCNVAHELLHCCNVWHHGDLDLQQYWQASDDGTSIHQVNVDQNGNATGRAGIPNISLFDESDPEHEIPTPDLFNAGKPVPVWIGEPHGQHSGDEDCVMRYDVGMAYPKASGGGYFWVWGKEPTGESLCDTINGHDFNKQGRTPQPRYLETDEKRNRGRCAEQIDVNDANRPPRR